jgi:phosphoglycerate kinase
MKTVNDIGDLKGKRVLVRADFDVPVGEDQAIQEPFRITQQKDLIDHLVGEGASVMLVAHISAVESFAPILSQVEEILHRPLTLVADISDAAAHAASSTAVGLLDNIRRWEGEKANDPEFARQLAQGFDFYINNAFAVSHRSHASVVGITKHLPSFAGFVLEREVKQLSEVIAAPAHGKVIVMGGAKASTKVPVIKHFMDKADAILVGGVVANDILKARGQDIVQSIVDEDAIQLLKGVDLDDDKLIIPHDFHWGEGKILDIGPESIKKFEAVISQASMVIWNGPMGLFEDRRFALGTSSIARAIAKSSAASILGGGDTISAISQFGVADKFTFVSTGGGAMLAFLAGEKLPGLDALHYYDHA